MRELRDILEHYTTLRSSGAPEEVVLGTVVDVRGSSYRRPGARMLLTASGERFGMISGGCLDKDIARRAWAWTDDGPKTVLYDTHGDALHPQGRYGSGCDGLVHILLERLPGHTTRIDPLRAIMDTWESSQPQSMATFYAAEGAFKDLIGRRVILSASGEVKADASLPPVIHDDLVHHLNTAQSWGRPRSVGLRVHEGTLTALVEPIRGPMDLLIFGAGDDARPLSALATAMGWRVRVADTSETLATQRRFPNAREVVSGPAPSLLERLAIGPQTYVVVMTHNFNDDLALLPGLLATQAPYIGLMGPRRRTRNLMRSLLDAGQLPDAQQLARVQTPIGLDLGGDAPEEVALAILGAVVAFRNGREGGLLKDREGAIHDEHERLLREPGHDGLAREAS